VGGAGGRTVASTRSQREIEVAKAEGHELWARGASGFYSSDFAADLRGFIGAIARLPFGSGREGVPGHWKIAEGNAIHPA
jgi:hypothetical protein